MSLSAKLLPAAVKGTKVWNPDLFKATISVPVVSVKDLSQLPKIKKELKSVLLKGRNLNHILDGDEPGHKLLALDPEKIRSLEDLPSELPGLDEQCEPLARREIQLDVSHWRAPELLEAVLAEVEPGVPTLSSYSLIGHIAHVNLRDYHLPYKSVIGDILLHTLSHVKLVVNKTNTIDNTFRLILSIIYFWSISFEC